MFINDKGFRNYMKTFVDLFWKFLVTIREFLGEFFLTKPVIENSCWKPIKVGLALLAENLRNGEVLVAREDGDDVVEVRFHGTLVVDAEEMSDGTSSPRAYKGTEWTTPASEYPFSEAFMARSGLYSRR